MTIGGPTVLRARAPSLFSTFNEGFENTVVIPSPSTSHPQAFHRLSKQRAMIPQDHPRGVVAGRAGDAAAGMSAGTAVIKPF
jgi:hypothetical protein